MAAAGVATVRKWIKKHPLLVVRTTTINCYYYTHLNCSSSSEYTNGCCWLLCNHSSSSSSCPWMVSELGVAVGTWHQVAHQCPVGVTFSLSLTHTQLSNMTVSGTSRRRRLTMYLFESNNFIFFLVYCTNAYYILSKHLSCVPFCCCILPAARTTKHYQQQSTDSNIKL